jgi:hypothetical protein
MNYTNTFQTSETGKQVNIINISFMSYPGINIFLEILHTDFKLKIE